MSRSRKADNILQALLTHHTIRAAAAAAGVTERTVYDYLSDTAFKTRYQAARDDVIRGVANNLRVRMSRAVDVLAAIMDDAEGRPQDRKSAAIAILDYGARLNESLDILERMAELERKMSKYEE